MSTLTTQSKVKESRVKESKVSSRESKIETAETDDDVLTVLESYKAKIETPTRQVEQQLAYWLMIFDAAVILEAISRTQKNGKGLSYLTAILSDFNRKDVKSLKDIETYDRSFKQRQQSFTKPVGRQESLPKWAASDHEIKDQPVDAATEHLFKDTLDRIRSKK